MRTFVQIVFLMSLFFLSACEIKSTNQKLDSEKQSGRIKIVSSQIYSGSCGNDYNILILFDSISGKEFICIPGSGISRIE